MSKPTIEDAFALIEDAWRKRREAFDAAEAEKEAAFQEVTADLSQAAAICRNLNDPGNLSIALRRLGHAYMDRNKFEEARASMAQAVVAARESEDSLSIAHTVRHLGDVELHAEDLDAAEAHYSEALALYQAHDNPPDLDFANALRPMAILKEKTGELEESKRLRQKTKDLYAKAGIG